MPKSSTLFSLIFFATIIIGFFTYKSLLPSPTPIQINQVSTTSFPITGSFYMSDLVLSYTQLETVLEEMRKTGIDTVITLASGDLTKNKDGTFTEKIYMEDPAYNFSRDLFTIAKAKNMKIIAGLASVDRNNIEYLYPTDDSPDASALINYSAKLVGKIYSELDRQNIPYNDVLAGFYIGQEAWVGSLGLGYYSAVSRAVKNKINEKGSNQLIVVSPYTYDEADYSGSYTDYFKAFSNTDIDVIALQDSMGTGKVTSAEKDIEHFKALSNALRDSGKTSKQAWANIETFQGSGWTYNPSDITRVKNQISYAAPYVNKMITWIYQHSMLSNPYFDNLPDSWGNNYTLAKSIKRKQLRNDYLKAYSPAAPMYYYEINQKLCLATSSTYTDLTLCQNNLATYLPGKTTGKCYTDGSACKSANSAPMYYFETVQKSCLATTNSYYDKDSCQTNLNIYLNNKTTGLCYYDLMTCKSANPTINKPGDLNGDGKVNIYDYSKLISGYGKVYTNIDFINILANYGK